MNTTTPTVADLLKYADLQMAAEAFLVDQNGALKSNLQKALTEGNNHASKFTALQAAHFTEFWKVVAQQPNTTTGFSGTLFECIKDDPSTGAKFGEQVMSFRSTEFIDDAARDNQATNSAEIKETGFAWGQLRDMEAWYQQLVAQGKLTAGNFSVTGYSLGGHLASAFNEMHPNAAAQVVTFNGAGIGGHAPTKPLLTLVNDFAALARGNLDGSSKFSFDDPKVAEIFARARKAIKGGGTVSAVDTQALQVVIESTGGTPAKDLLKQQAILLKTAILRVDDIHKEIDRIAKDVRSPGSPVYVPYTQVSQHDLDYQLAVLTMAPNGNDYLEGNAGNDELNGGEGDGDLYGYDLLFGDAGPDSANQCASITWCAANDQRFVEAA